MTVIQACDAIIQPRDYAKNLEMYFDKHMLFEKHIQEISKKTFGIFMYINRIEDLFIWKTRISIVQTLVLSLINYGWHCDAPPIKHFLKKVQKLQNFFVKVAI